MPTKRDWARALADRSWESDAIVLKHQGGSWVRRATLLGREVVVKTLPSSGVIGAIKSALRLSRAWRQARGAARLERAGIPTARALAVVRTRGHEHLILPALRGETVLSLVAGGGLPPTRAAGLARALGRQVAQLDAIGLFNRDHKPSNLVVTGWAGDDPTIAVVDTVAIQRRRALPRMLFALLVEPLGVGAPPTRAQRMRVLLAALDSVQPGLPRPARRAQRDRWWAEIRAMLEGHGDPSPRVLPTLASENRSAACS
ncbi:MAG: hypothetical protein JNM80_08645 [Phycisphaerae bacterium]|nr:hypothetical protein [Phycisphaerae bacterium]